MTNTHETDVVICGGGPAGMLLGLLLARAGIRSIVLERNSDFAREYRGEVLLPRFAQMMQAAGLLDFLLGYRHLKLKGFELFAYGRHITSFSIERMAPEMPYILWMPQPVMLGAFLDKARTFPRHFSMWFDTRVDDLIQENGVTKGVRITKSGQPASIRAKVTVGADGRGSLLRRKGGFELAYEDHDFDLLWFTVPKPPAWENHVRAFISTRHNYLTLPKLPDLIQVGVLIKSGEFDEYKRKGIKSLRTELIEAHPAFGDFARGLKDFGPFVLLPAIADRVKEWAKDGLLLIGDAAHTCSPAGAVGVSVAVGTAIAAAEVIQECFKTGDFSKNALSQVQAKREKEVIEIQAIQSRAAPIFNPANPLAKAWSLIVLMILAKTSLLMQVQRRLFVLKKK